MIDPTIDHIDRNNKNNTINNLRYLSRHDNIMHREPARGVNNGGNIYDKYTIKEIIDYRIKHPKIGCVKLHQKFKVSPAQIFRIISKKIWKYLTEDVIFDILDVVSDPNFYCWRYKNFTDEVSILDKYNPNKVKEECPDYIWFDNEYSINDL